MKPAAFPIPNPWDFNEKNEIGLLYLLFESLEVVSRAIMALHPVVLNDDRPYWLTLSADEKAAKRLLANLQRLSKSILLYRKIASHEKYFSTAPYDGHAIATPRKAAKPDPPASWHQLGLPFPDSPPSPVPEKADSIRLR
jgi:hypothetical protein